MGDADESVTAGRTIAGLLRDGVLDAQLAALVWLLADGRVPLLVAAPASAAGAGDELAGALAAFVPPSAGRAIAGPAGIDGDPISDVLVARWLDGGSLRRAIRGVARGFGLVGALQAGSLEAVRARLAGMTVGASPELISRLGAVLVLGEEPSHRVVAAHYMRPVARDAAGHIQRLPPAVLATWEPPAGRWDHFSWALYPELAHRLGQRPGDLEREHEERSKILAALIRANSVDADQVAATLAHARGHAGTRQGPQGSVGSGRG